MNVLRTVTIVLLMLTVKILLNPTSVDAVTTLSTKVLIQAVLVVFVVPLLLTSAESESMIVIKTLNATIFLKDTLANVAQSSLINLQTESLIQVDSVFLDQLHPQMSAELTIADLARLS